MKIETPIKSDDEKDVKHCDAISCHKMWRFRNKMPDKTFIQLCDRHQAQLVAEMNSKTFVDPQGRTCRQFHSITEPKPRRILEEAK